MGRKRTAVDAIRADLTVDAQWIAIDAMMDEGASEERIERARMEANLFALLLAANALDKPERKQNADDQFPTMERREIKIAGATFRLSRGGKAKVWGIVAGCGYDLMGTTDAIIGCAVLISKLTHDFEVTAWKQATAAIKRLEDNRDYLRLPEDERAAAHRAYAAKKFTWGNDPAGVAESLARELEHANDKIKRWLPHYETIRYVLSAGRLEI